MISKIDYLASGNPCYLLHTLWTEYDLWYGEDELRIMTDEEVRDALLAVLLKKKNQNERI